MGYVVRQFDQAPRVVALDGSIVPLKLYRWALDGLPAEVRASLPGKSPALVEEVMKETVKQALDFYKRAGFDQELTAFKRVERTLRTTLGRLDAETVRESRAKVTTGALLAELDKALEGKVVYIGVPKRAIWRAFKPMVHGFMEPLNLATLIHRHRPQVFEALFDADAKPLEKAIREAGEAIARKEAEGGGSSPLDRLKAVVYVHRVAGAYLDGLEGYRWLVKQVEAVRDRDGLRGEGMLTFNELLLVAEDTLFLSAWALRVNRETGRNPLL